MEKAKRYAKRFEAAIAGLFVLAALVPVSVLGILHILVAGWLMPVSEQPPLAPLAPLAPSAPLDPASLGFYLKLSAVLAVIITAIVAAVVAGKLARRITRPFYKLLAEAGDRPVKVPKGLTAPLGTLDAVAEMAETTAVELSAAKVYTEDVISSTADGAVIVGAGHSVQAANRVFLGLLGYAREDVVGMPFERFYEEASSTETLFQGLTRRGAVTGLELFLKTADGGKLPVSVSASRLAPRDTDKTGGAFIILARDLRETNALVEELEAAKKELAKKVRQLEEFKEGVLYMLRDLEKSEGELSDAYSKLKGAEAQLVHSSKLSSLGELSADVAHELNQPLTVIRGLTQNMLQKERRSGGYDKLKLIDRAARKMENVINHMRVFVRAEEAALAPVDLNRVIRDALIMVKEHSKKQSVRLKLELEKIPAVTGCASRLEQVVINLITNANDAMGDGGTITISTESFEKRGKTFIRAAFRDTGPGIPLELRKRIFDSYFTTKEAGKGTGLGLSISQGIIKDHKGKITARSKAGEGTTFEITLPAGV